MEKAKCFKIGYVAKTHGLKGEVTIMYTDAAPLLTGESVKSVFIELKSYLVPYFIEHVSSRQDKAFIKFEDVNTLEAANMLKGGSIYLEKSLRSKLKKGEFYDDEVIDFIVEDEDLGLLGAIKEVIQSGPNRLLALDYLGKEVLIPITGPFIQSINKTKKKIIVLLPDGFLDL